MKTVLLPRMTTPVTTLCLGTSPLGHLPTPDGGGVSEERAAATIAAAVRSPIRFLDTSNGYGASERRIGRVLATTDVQPDYVIATKADPLGGDFSGARVRASFAESRERLGRDRFGLYYLHDPEHHDVDALLAPGGAVEAMQALRDEGLVDAIGVAGGDLGVMTRLVDLGVFDVALNHNRYTLLDRSASALLDQCAQQDVAFINAAPFASGLLAKPGDGSATYHYGIPSPEVVAATAELQALCLERELDLAAVALRFSTRDPRVASTVVGVSRPERVAQLLTLDAAEIPDDIWVEVDHIHAALLAATP